MSIILKKHNLPARNPPTAFVIHFSQSIFMNVILLIFHHSHLMVLKSFCITYVIIKKWGIVLNIPIICTHTTRNQLYLFFVLQNLASLDSVLQDFCHGLMSLMQLFCQVVCMVFIIFNVGRCKSFPLRARSRYVRNVAVLSSQPFVLALAIRPSAH